MNSQIIDILYVTEKLAIEHLARKYSQYFPRFAYFAVISPA